jgi:hypothetical protein
MFVVAKVKLYITRIIKPNYPIFLNENNWGNSCNFIFN